MRWTHYRSRSGALAPTLRRPANAQPAAILDRCGRALLVHARSPRSRWRLPAAAAPPRASALDASSRAPHSDRLLLRVAAGAARRTRQRPRLARAQRRAPAGGLDSRARSAVRGARRRPRPGGAAAGRIHRRRRSPRRSARATCWSSTSAAPAAPTRSAARRWNASATSPVSHLFEQCALQIGPARGGASPPRKSVRGHRGPAGRGRLRKARPVRHLLRHEGGARVRRTLPPARRSAGARLGRPGRRPGTVRIPRLPALRRCCGNSAPAGACAGITANPVADLAALNARLRAHALGGSVYDGTRPPPPEHALDERAAADARGRRPEPGAAGAAAGRGALRAARATPIRCCACTSSPRA